MPSTYTTNLGIEKIGTGEQSGTWGDTTNTNFDLIDQAINGIGSKTVSSTSTASPTQIQITDGSISDGRDAFIEFTSATDLGAAGAVQLTPNDAEKIVHVRNSLQGSQSLILFQGTYNASNDYVVPNGADVLLKFSGTGSGSTVTAVQINPKFDGTATFADISVTNNISVTGTVDGRDIAADGTKLDGIDDNANNYSLPKATTTVRGGVELGSDTVQTVAANSVSATAGKTYAVQLNSADQMVVNVPWSDTSNPGTVTSVATANGTGISVTGGPITTSGTLTITNTAPDTGVPALLGTGGNVSLNTGITAAEVRTAIGAGTSSTTGTVTSVATGTGLTGGTITSSGTISLAANQTLASGNDVFVGASTSYTIFQSSSATKYHRFYLETVEEMRLTEGGQLDVNGNVVAYSTTVSDERLKDNVETIDGALEKVERLRGVTFEWNKGSRQGQKDIGLIAQEVQEVLPELVVETKDSLIDGEDYLTVSYGQVVSVLIEAVKELSAEVKALKEAK